MHWISVRFYEMGDMLNRGGKGQGREGELKCYIHTYRQTYRHTDPLTKWVVEELSLLKKHSLNT